MLVNYEQMNNSFKGVQVYNNLINPINPINLKISSCGLLQEVLTQAFWEDAHKRITNNK